METTPALSSKRKATASQPCTYVERDKGGVRSSISKECFVF